MIFSLHLWGDDAGENEWCKIFPHYTYESFEKERLTVATIDTYLPALVSEPIITFIITIEEIFFIAVS